MRPIFPTWARLSRSESETGDGLDLASKAGAALGFVGLLIDAPSAPLGCWLDRLALRAAAVSMALEGRPERDVEIRDAWHQAGPNDDPGPAGRAFALWRRIAGRSAPLAEPDLAATMARGFGLRSDAALSEAIESARHLSEGALSPLVAAAEAAAGSVRRCPALPALSLLLADAVLARRLGWPVTVPLVAIGLEHRALEHRALRVGAPDWPRVCLAAVARGGAVAWDRHTEIARRAEILHAVREQLR